MVAQLREENLALRRVIDSAFVEMTYEHETIREQQLVHHEESLTSATKRCEKEYKVKMEELKTFKREVEKQMTLERQRMAEKSKGMEQLYNEYQRAILNLE